MILFPKRVLPGIGAVDYRPHCVLTSALYHHMLVELFAQIRDLHVFCSHTINEGLFSSIGGVVFANINC